MSVIVETTVGSIIAMLLEKGATKLQAISDTKGNVTISGFDAKGKQKDFVTIPIKQKPDTFSFTELGRATTIAVSKPDTPDLEFNNPRKVESVITGISIIPNSAFKTKGLVIITVNKVTVYKNKAAGDFTDLIDSKVDIPRGKTIKPSDKVRVHLWTSDGTSSSLTVQVTFGSKE